MSGPLEGVRIVELAGIGPTPFAGMMLADAGADIIRIDRVDSLSTQGIGHSELLNRGRRSVAIDLKHTDGVELVLDLIEKADGFMEGFRPGVTERLGLGPKECFAHNPRLVYGRMTGWGQEGPLAMNAGHDINYIALAGALGSIGRAGMHPVPPVNMLGDFGGGGMLLAFGMSAGLVRAQRSGEGQVIDAAMVDGTALLTTMIHGMRMQGNWSDDRGTNLLDSGAHFYEVYETSDGGFLAVGAIESQFYEELIHLLGLSNEHLPEQMDRVKWPEMKRLFSRIFLGKSRSEWEDIFSGSDACVTPVLPIKQSMDHPHLRARGTFIEVEGVKQPAPAPRFQSTPGTIRRPPPGPGEGGDDALIEWSINEERIASLRVNGVIL